YGLAGACDTLVAQTFGGKNLLRVGVILQKSILILLLFCLPCWALLINAEAILLCMGQDPEAMFINHLLISYLQNQVIILPQLCTAVAANILQRLDCLLGLFAHSGSVAANALYHFYSCGFLFAYIRWKKLHVKTWGGEALAEWGSYMKLSIASTFMKCAEWWVYEFGGFFAGMMSEDELAAQHGVIMIFPMGIQAAACARVGNALGAGNTSGAKLTMKFSFGLGIVLGSIKHVIGYIFTNDDGIFVGSGKQKIPAVANIFGYYGIGLTMGLVLMFVAKLRILGFWLGLLICVSLQSTFYIIVIIFKLNWKNITDEVNCTITTTYLYVHNKTVSMSK
uniref:Solute carrier family 47 member 4 n=1 Tax=Neogobius melanostomus TaxID=47308 RepID=A0A8C6TJR2_9GOBI